MRTLFYILLLMFAASCSRGDGKPRHERIDIATVEMSDTVWVCTSSGAKRFHASDTCGGIRACGETIIKTTRYGAELCRKTYCHKCYYKNN